MEELRLDLTPEEFVIRAIEKLRQPSYNGIHSVYSGFNQAFRGYFTCLDPVETINELAEQGKIEFRPTRGGVLLYKMGEGPSSRAKNTLTRILSQEKNDEM